MTHHQELRTGYKTLLAQRPLLGDLSGIRAGVGDELQDEDIVGAGERGWVLIRIRLDQAQEEHTT